MHLLLDYYDYFILKARIASAMKIMHLGIKSYLGKHEKGTLTKEQTEEKFKQLKRIGNIMSKIEKLPKSVEKCMQKAIGKILDVPRSEEVYDLGKMLKSMEIYLGVLPSP